MESTDSQPARANRPHVLTPDALFRQEALRASNELPFVDYGHGFVNKPQQRAALVAALSALALACAVLFWPFPVSTAVTGEVFTNGEGTFLRFDLPAGTNPPSALGLTVMAGGQRTAVSRLELPRTPVAKLSALAPLPGAALGPAEATLLLGERRLFALLSERSAR